jgi:hypothetical protein
MLTTNEQQVASSILHISLSCFVSRCPLPALASFFAWLIFTLSSATRSPSPELVAEWRLQ